MRTGSGTENRGKFYENSTRNAYTESVAPPSIVAKKKNRYHAVCNERVFFDLEYVW